MTSVTTNMMTMRPMATPAMAAISTAGAVGRRPGAEAGPRIAQWRHVHASGMADASSRYSRRVRRR